MEIISRKEAIGQKLTKYYTGKPCPNCHVSERYVANWNCVACGRLHKESFHKKNPEKKEVYKQRNIIDRELHPEKRKTWRDTHTESIKKSHEKFHEKNPTYSADYRKNNPEMRAKHKLKRKLCIKQAMPVWYEKDLINTLYKKRDELSELWDISLHVDHIIPLQSKLVCGLHCWDNLQLLEAGLNQTKSNKFKG